jgi:thiol:disulfide interchange protein
MLLLLLAVAISANLLGLFELPVLGGRAEPAGSFGTGALAAFVATPCAGPFLGAALGTALLLPPVGSIAVFAALGFGLAVPFLAIALVPALQDKLPKPGRWMDRLKRFLAIPMTATAVACLWLLQRLAGRETLLIGISAAVLLLVVASVAGAMQRRGKGGLAVLGAGALLVAAGALTIPAGAASSVHAPAGAESWSESKVATYVAQHHPVFVYFTADWCLSCKLNEAAAIDRDEVRSAFRKANVKVLAGDWTKGDPAITRFLEGRGRAGVPYYLWYTPGQQPEELPQILTPGMLISRAERARNG